MALNPERAFLDDGCIGWWQSTRSVFSCLLYTLGANPPAASLELRLTRRESTSSAPQPENSPPLVFRLTEFSD
jgi:hypothetical protein